MMTIQEQIKEINTRLNYWDSVRDGLIAMNGTWKETELDYWNSVKNDLVAMNGTWKGTDMITISDNELDDIIRDIYVKQSIYLEQWVILNDELNSTEKKEQITEAEVLKPKLYSLKFYADDAGGISNKFFCYPVHHGGHTADLLTRFIKSGLTIKAAYLVGGLGGKKGVQLGTSELAYLTCSGEKEKNRIRTILMSKFPKLG